MREQKLKIYIYAYIELWQLPDFLYIDSMKRVEPGVGWGGRERVSASKMPAAVLANLMNEYA